MESVVFVGIQGTGKSTFFRERYFRTHVRINLDMLKTRNREDLLLRACIEGLQPFVVDNTNPTIEERAKYIRVARQARFRVVGYYFESKIADALQRNEGRPPDQRIPRVGLLGTHKKLQLPSLSEGFDELFYVKINGDGSFSLNGWEP